MKNKWVFVAKFLIVFAALTILGAVADIPRRYATVLARSAALLTPLTSGWSLEERHSGGKTRLWFRRGGEQMVLALSLEAMALSLLPLLSLIGATTAPTWSWRLRVIALGVIGLFALDLLVLLLYPALVVDSAISNIGGTFLGMLTFVGAPVILWFALTYPQMRPTWRL